MNVLVVGGDAASRAEVAEAFHRESPLRVGPLLRVDAVRDAAGLLAALRTWASGTRPDAVPHQLRAAERGTLFVDSITRLEPEAQRLLLVVGARCFAADLESVENGPGRLVVGSQEDPSLAVAAGEFSAALFDCLDKVRIEIPSLARGAA